LFNAPKHVVMAPAFAGTTSARKFWSVHDHPATTSLLDRAISTAIPYAIRSRAGKGADEGEMSWEYSQTEALCLNNGRSSRPLEPRRDLDLRAVKDDAVGYAHPPRFRCRRDSRGRPRSRGARRLLGSFAAAAPHTNVRLYGDENPLDARAFEAKVKLLAKSTPMSRKDPRVPPGSLRPRRTPGKPWRSCVRTAKATAESAPW